MNNSGVWVNQVKSYLNLLTDAKEKCWVVEESLHDELSGHGPQLACLDLSGEPFHKSSTNAGMT